jgi:pyrroloquinoline quinone (PQQ) biosynthesis protein C
MSIAMEWAEVAPGCIVVATAERVWLHTPVFSGQPDLFALPMEGPGGVETTRRLLDGAIGAAGRRKPAQAPAPPPPAPQAAPPLTPARWAWRLAGYYQTTHATPRLMAAAAERFAAAGRAALAAWAREKVRDEAGHDRLALRDLDALGYDAARVVDALVPPTAAALVRYFEARVLEDDDPIGCVGYAYALERLALERGARDIAAVEAILPRGVVATRCLRVHSAAGSDAAHVEETVRLVSQLTAGERTRVARACYETAAIYCTPPANGFITEEALVQTLSALENGAESRREKR